MEKKRTQIIKDVFDDIHGNLVPMFRWINYSPMEYWYNHDTDCMECDCGISVPFNVKDEDINFTSVDKALDELEDKVRDKFLKEKNIYLDYGD